MRERQKEWLPLLIPTMVAGLIAYPCAELTRFIVIYWSKFGGISWASGFMPFPLELAVIWVGFVGAVAVSWLGMVYAKELWE